MKHIASSAALAAALVLAAPAVFAQNHVVVTKTLVSNSAHRECMAISERQLLRFWYRAEGPIDFDIQYIENDETTYPVRQAKQSLGSGSYTPNTPGDYCMVWTNTSKQPVLFRFELARLLR
jgi:hypothetical protein